jgi:glutamate-1-semialdehyde aminotransferase
MFGKALGNGYAINAIIGKKSVMNYTKSTFISSTFWTERIGTIAALKTLQVMNKYKSWKLISEIGNSIKNNWNKLADLHKIKLDIMGVEALPTFNFIHKDNLYFKTYLSQEMLKKKILASNSIYVSIKHNKNILNKYYEILDKIFFQIKECISEKKNIRTLLDGPVCISGMRSKNIKFK